MRITFKLLTMGLLILGLFSCKDELEDADTIDLSAEVLTFTVDKGQQTLLVNSTAADWKASTEADWVFTEISADGDKLIVSVDANETFAARSAILTFRGGNCVREIDVLQEAKAVSLELTASSGEVYDLNEMYAVGVKTHMKWTATVDGSWLTLDKNSGEGNDVVAMKFSRNQSASSRTATVTFTAEDQAMRTFTLVQREVMPSDRQHDSLALVALYHSMQGEKWENQGNWMSGQPINSWLGVIVENDRVVQLTLNRRKCNADTYLAPEIKYLTAMQQFSVAYSQVGGSIPNEIGRCVSMKSFSSSCYEEGMGGNMKGSLPVIFCSLPELYIINVSMNQMSGELPWEYLAARKLGALDFERNAFTGEMPEVWGQSSIITQINVSHNKLSGSIPESYGNMRNLGVLYLSYNPDLTGNVPDELCRRKKLGGLELSIKNTQIISCQ